MFAREGITAFDFCVDESHLQKLIHSRSIRLFSREPNLLSALRLFPLIAKQQTTHCSFWLESAGDRACLRFTMPLPPEVPGHETAEIYTIRLVIALLGSYVGQTVAPTQLFLTNPRPGVRRDCEQFFEDVPVRAGQRHGGVEFPISLLSAPGVLPVETSGNDANQTGSDEPPKTLAGTLAESLAPYLLDGYVSLDEAAQLMECSVRTLQRRLAREKTTFRAVLHQARSKVATSALQNNTRSIQEISCQLGYSEQSAFTRAFRSWTGQTPAAYRNRLEAGRLH
jgi:AraC-like DNA-binding protein